MVVGVLRITVEIPWAGSLKDKRSVVKSLKDRLHREHLVAVAEVDRHDAPTASVIAVAAAGAEGKRVAQTLDRITDKLRAATDAEVVSVERRVMTAAQLGLGVIEPEEIDEAAIAAEMLDRAGDDAGGEPGEDPGVGP